MCVYCTFFVHREVSPTGTEKTFSSPLLNLLSGSANIALVHFGGESKGVERLREALLLGADVDEHQGL